MFRCIKEHKADAATKNKLYVPKVSGRVPLIGHVVQFTSDPTGFLLRCRKTYGAIFQIQLLSDTYILCDGTYRKEYFGSSSKLLDFDKVVIKSLVMDHTIGRDAVTNPWHHPIIRRQFGVKSLHLYLRRVEKQVLYVLENELGNLKVGGSCNVDDPQLLAWRIIASCSASSFLGDTLSQREEILDVFINFHKACFKIIELGNIFPHALLGVATKNVRLQKEIIKRALLPEIERRRELMNSQQDVPDDLLNVILKSKQHTPEEIAARMMSFIFLSMISTAGVMVHALNDLAGRQEQWEPLAEEQKVVLKEHGPSMTTESLDAMPRLHAFVWESMRMGALPFQTTRLVVGDNVKFGDFYLPKGAIVAMSGFLAGMDETVVEAPTEFRPERFLVDNNSSLTSNPEDIGFFPFGGVGQRHYCAGRYFAQAELKSALAIMLRTYRIQTVSGNVPEYIRTATDSSRVIEPIRFERLV